MKFAINRTRFIEGLKTVQNIVVAKGVSQILQNVMIEAAGGKIVLTTTNLDISIRCSVECDVPEEGVTTLPVKLLFSAMAKAPEGNVEVRVGDDDGAVISAGKARYKIKGLPSRDFPRMNLSENVCEYRLPRQILLEMLRKTAYAASQDDTRRTLKGVLLSFRDAKLTMVATDGRRLAMVEEEVEFPVSAARDIVLPSKAVVELQRSLSGEGEVVVKVEKSQICFDIDGVSIYSKLIEDTYPNYMQVIPKENDKTIQVDRQSLLEAIDRASVMNIDEANSTKLIFESNRLTVMSAASEIGEVQDEVAIKYAGEKIEIMFDPNYVMDPLKAIDDDEVTINLKNGTSPAVIKCSIPFLYVLMPLRVS